MILNKEISESMTIKLEEVFDELPDMPEFVKGIRRAPKRDFNLSKRNRAGFEKCAAVYS